MSGPLADPRVCMPTWRAFDRYAYLSCLYESADVLADSCDLDLLEIQAGRGFRTRESWQRRLVWHDPSGLTARLNPGLEPVTVTQDYDLFVIVCQTLKELLYLNSIKGWKERCRTSVCIIDEIYVAEVKQSKNFLRLLRQFDHVFTELRESAEPISEIIERPCHYLTAAVDTLRFTPYPNPPARSVDVHSIGRRRPGIHDALLALARRDGIFYVYDIFEGGAETRVLNYREHRDLIAAIAKRSRFFMVAPAKWDVPQETRGQVAIANRYFEGAAAGAVLLGQSSATDEFRELFDWDDVVVEIRADGADVEDVLRALAADPERVMRMSRRNAAQALLRHDWVYRWRDLFEHVGLTPGPALLARERRLRELAALAAESAAEPEPAARRRLESRGRAV